MEAYSNELDRRLEQHAASVVAPQATGPVAIDRFAVVPGDEGRLTTLDGKAAVYDDKGASAKGSLKKRMKRLWRMNGRTLKITGRLLKMMVRIPRMVSMALQLRGAK